VTRPLLAGIPRLRSYRARAATALRAQPSPDHRLSYAARVRLALEILVTYVESRRALKRAPIETVLSDLRSYPTHTGRVIASVEDARRLGWVVTRSLAHVPGDTRCLVRSLVLVRLLARRGIRAKLVIGARTTPEFLAHAWVEHEGQPLLSPGGEVFGRLIEL
jgi:hypothetical protein